jgi:hypothetical protein
MKRAYDGHAEEWHALERLAFAYLDKPHSIPKAQDLQHWQNLLRLWHYPSFTEHRAWSIYQQTKPSDRITKTSLRQVTWNRQFDAERLFKPMEGLQHGLHPQPTIEVRDRPLDTDEFKRRVLALEDISFNLFAGRPLGIDGETFGIEYPFAGLKANWWCEGPGPWKDLTAWAADMRRWLSSVADEEPDRNLWALPNPRLP